jgi:hypothetical protein
LNKHHQSILIYLLTFLILSILLKLWGIIDFDNREIWGYGLIFYGISLVYLSFGNNQRGRLFIGSVLFLSGLFLYVISKFEFFQVSPLIFPALLLLFSLSFFMLFLDNYHDKTTLIISVLFFISGTIVTLYNGEISFSAFFDAIWHIILNYWPVVLIAIGIILIIYRERE